MEIIPGEPHWRPEPVRACAPYTAEMANLEEEYRHNAVIVVIIGDRDALSCSHVTAAFTEWLRVSKHLMNVTLFRPEGFLVLFKEEGLRGRALALRPGVKIRGEAIRVMPWTRLSHACRIPLHATLQGQALHRGGATACSST